MWVKLSISSCDTLSGAFAMVQPVVGGGVRYWVRVGSAIPPPAGVEQPLEIQVSVEKTIQVSVEKTIILNNHNIIILYYRSTLQS